MEVTAGTGAGLPEQERVAYRGSGHVPVLADEVIDWLGIQPEGVYIDCTAGAGGHSFCIAERLAGGRLFSLDRDASSVALAQARLESFPCATVLHRNYGELATLVAELGIGRVHGVLIDAGVSSMQLDTPTRGFSFQEEGPLDMRMDADSGLTAAAYLRQVGEDELARVLRDYGDVGPARRIAKSILERAGQGRMVTTRDLAQAVEAALDFLPGMPEEVRTVFQAIRIAVNDEYRWLEAGVRGAIEVLAPRGRLVVISFHSGEDRIVKNVFRDASRAQRLLHPDGRVRETIAPCVRLLTPKPVRPSERECLVNPRSKSARLRAAERLEGKESAA